jgi:hypothetical protein
MKQLISLILVFTLIFPATLFAADPPPTEPAPPITTETTPPIAPKPTIMGLREGQPAPYSGVLLNPLAAAKLFVDKDFSEQECALRIEYAVQRELAKANLLLESTRVRMHSMEQRYVSIITIKDTEIKRLSELATNQNDYSVWWAAGGVVVGIGLTLAVVYGVKSM